MSLRLHSNLFYQKFVNDESPATASLRSATPKKNVLSFLEEIGRAQIRKARNIFLQGTPNVGHSF